jgi:hypothetical protein
MYFVVGALTEVPRGDSKGGVLDPKTQGMTDWEVRDNLSEFHRASGIFLKRANASKNAIL